MTLRVDVVVNNHNYGRYLADAIDSALSQTHPAVAVVVVDDGSTDESRAVIAQYGDRVRAVLKDNGGQASALNAGFAASDGDIVVFLDSDDVLAADTAAMVSDAFEADTRLAKVQYRLAVIDADGVPTGETRPAPHLPLPSGDVRRRELRSPFDVVWLSTSGMALARWVLERLFPIPEDDFRDHPDWYLQHLPALLGPVTSLDRVGGQYRLHGANSYALATSTLDVAQLRRSIEFADVTRRHLTALADELEIDRPADVVSVADVANRLISLRLDPARHPLAADTRVRLVRAGWRAAARRDDTSWLLRAAFGAWFTTVGIAPKPVARALSERFLFPERRAGLNGVLGRLHRGRQRG